MIKHFRVASLLCAFSILAGVVGTSPLAVVAQTVGAGIHGTLVDQAGGVPIGNANVTLYQGEKRVGQIQSQANGSFAFPSEPPGIYQVEVRAQGYQTIRSSDITAARGASTDFRTALTRISSGNSNFREIGRVSVSGGRSSISTSTTISSTVTSDELVKEGYNRIGDVLNTLPGANTTGNSSSVGDDQQVDIRGYGSDETQSLIDGHPIGPIGKGGDGFSGQVSPSFAIAQTRVTFGSGALGLYGTDSIGGTIDQQTLNPTRTPHFQVTEGIGNLGKALSDIQATGTVGKLGYALVHAVQGTYGPYKPSQRPQPGLVSTDLTSATLAANTYTVSQNYLLRNDLLKLRYQFDDKTQLTVSGLSATSWDDKSGNGDNCYNSPGYQLYKGQQTAASPNTFPANPTPSLPALITCANSVAVLTNGGPACITPQQYANATTGLQGGGPGPWQSRRVGDYHARLSRQFGDHLVTLDGFTNRYTVDYNRNVNGGFDSTCNCFIGGFHSDFYQTTGLLISDDIATARNDLGFGYYLQHQRITGDEFPNPKTGAFKIVPKQEYGLGDSNFFIREELQSSSAATYYLNAWLKHSTVTAKTTFDPRLSLVFRTSPSDVVRLTGGRSDGEPSPTIVQAAPSFNQTPSNITPSCGGLTNVGDVANKNLRPETSNDLEVGYGHRFNADTIIQVNGYLSFEKERIFSGNLPISATGAPIRADLLAAYFNRIQQFCPGFAPTINNLEVGTNYNAASTRYQGVEVSGRHRFNRNVYADYTYDIQSAVNLAIPDSILQNNATLINNAQIIRIPLHKASIGIDYSDLHGFEFRTDVYYLSDNNQYARPAFFYGNASISKDIGRYATLNLGVQNVFNSAVSSVYAFGEQQYQAENQFFSDSSAYAQAFNNNADSGLTGLVQPQFTLSLTLRR